jgi:acyl carrier protein
VGGGGGNASSSRLQRIKQSRLTWAATRRNLHFMGLEGVEIVMALEERFDIAIEDAEAEKTVTPGLLIELIMSKVGRTNDATCLTQRAFHRLRAALMRQFGLKRNQIRPETPLADLFPHPERKQRLRQTLADLGVKKDLALVLPGWLEKFLPTGFLGGTAAMMLYAAWHNRTFSNVVVNYVLSSPVLAAVIYAVLFLLIFFRLTRGLRREFSPAIQNIGELARWIMAYAPEAVQPPQGQWSREQVAEIVKEIVIEELSCAKQYREDAHFVKDLGMG